MRHSLLMLFILLSYNTSSMAQTVINENIEITNQVDFIAFEKDSVYSHMTDSATLFFTYSIETKIAKIYITNHKNEIMALRTYRNIILFYQENIYFITENKKIKSKIFQNKDNYWFVLLR